MSNRNGKKWNREETILAFELYCRTPFGKISSQNEDIRALASLLGRTPGSVALKMFNLAHYDPSLQAKNISGMAHGSKLDEEIVNEFYQNLGALKENEIIIAEQMGINEKATNATDEVFLPGDYVEQLSKRRIGQQAFRRTILNAYGKKCCVTGLGIESLLIASHIKPWADSDDKTEKTNPRNGLCLNALHDKAFDKGLITLDKELRIVESRCLKSADMDESTKRWLHKYNGEKIALPDKFLPAMEFIEYHNDVIFLG